MGTIEAGEARRILLLMSPATYRAGAFLSAAGELGLTVTRGIDLPPELARATWPAARHRGGRSRHEGGVWLRPEGFDPDQWWHWTPEWQEGEEEIERDRAAGSGGHVSVLGGFLAALELRIKRASGR